MRRLAALAVFISGAIFLGGCALRRNASFAFQRLSGLAPVPDCWTEGKHLRVCHWTPYGVEEDPKSVLFFFHYATGDEKSFSRVGLANSFYHRYKKRGKKAPRVFTLSYGSHWLVSGEAGQRQVVLREELEKTLDALEEDPKRKRYLWGLSMGGYNSAELALSSPGKWTAAAISCPALYARNPFSVNASMLKGKSLRDGHHLFTYRLGGARVWDLESPLLLAATPKDLPPILIESNAKDEFGFAEGARELARVLREGGKKVVYRELPGGHCVVGGASVADFFISLSEGK